MFKATGSSEKTKAPATLTLELHSPDDDARPVYIVGNFNHWVSKDARYQMERVSPGRYIFVFKEDLTALLGSSGMEYKYVKGGWEAEELDRDGFPPSNRKMAHPKGYVLDIAPKWKRHAAGYNPDFYPNIEIVSTRFNVPQLRKKRRISVLLPWNYHTEPQKRYPVLYLQDGQNLFESTAPFGTWGVDKRLAALAEIGRGEFIVVAIDHGGKERIQEFSPYNLPKWGDGKGREYAHFLAETLKPYIDKTFRTLPDRENTGIGGSSMGGLISLFAGFMYPNLYSKLLVFSPSLWVSTQIYTEPLTASEAQPMKIYLYAGEKEGANVVENIKKLKTTLENRGFSSKAVQFKIEIDSAGRHTEVKWGEEFPKATTWLYYGGE